MRQEAQASTGRPGSLVDLRKCRRIGVPANSVSLSSSSLQHWKSCMAKTFQQAFLVHSLCVYETICLLVMMATYHIMKTLLFFEKRRLTFFIWISYPSFLFFILYFKNQCNILYLQKWVFTVSWVYNIQILVESSLGCKNTLSKH